MLGSMADKNATKNLCDKDITNFKLSGEISGGCGLLLNTCFAVCCPPTVQKMLGSVRVELSFCESFRASEGLFDMLSAWECSNDPDPDTSVEVPW